MRNVVNKLNMVFNIGKIKVWGKFKKKKKGKRFVKRK